MSSEIKATKKMKKINEKICTMQQKNTCKKVADLVKSVKGTINKNRRTLVFMGFDGSFFIN